MAARTCNTSYLVSVKSKLIRWRCTATLNEIITNSNVWFVCPFCDSPEPMLLTGGEQQETTTE